MVLINLTGSAWLVVSPEGLADVYAGLSPPAGQASLNDHNVNKWISNKALRDNFSTHKFDSLVYERPQEVTPASTSGLSSGVSLRNVICKWILVFISCVNRLRKMVTTEVSRLGVIRLLPLSRGTQACFCTE